MWFLTNSKGERYYLLTGRQHTVGRKDADLLLLNDQSISRQHAIIHVEHKSENWAHPEKLPTVKLIEAGAKYGTTLNPQEGNNTLPAKSTHVLKKGDEIQFGLQWNLWKLEHEPLVVSLSTLNSEEKRNVKAMIAKLGGHVVDAWSAVCTHLTMCNITLTVKAICALAEAKPIVTPEMWNSYLSAAEKGEPLPSYEEFIPPLAETSIKKNEVCFKVNDSRKSLFKDKTFIFFTKAHCDQHKCLVLAAGGRAKCLETTEISKTELVSPDVVVMQHISERNSQASQVPSLYAEYITYLKSHGKRVVPISEIGLAILHCSLEKYCNPMFNFATALLKTHETAVSQELSEQILAMDTQEAEALCGKIKASSCKPKDDKKVIPPSGSSEINVPSTNQEVRSNSEELHDTFSMNTGFDNNMTTSPLKKTKDVTGNKCSSSINQINSPMKIFKRRIDDGEDTQRKRQRMEVKEEQDDDSDLFTFASDREEPKDEDDLFSFVDDEKSNKAIPEPAAIKNVKKRKVFDGFDDSLNPPKKPMIDHASETCTVETSSKTENRSVESQRDFIPMNLKCEAGEDEDMDIQCKLNKTAVLFKEMVVRKKSESIVDNSATDKDKTSNLKNFKKFRKAQNPYQRSTPFIIGGQDLIVYDNLNNSLSRVMDRSSNEKEHDEEEEEEDDEWAFQLSQNTRKLKSR